MNTPYFVALLLMLSSLGASCVNAKELVYTRAFADDDYGSYHVAVLEAALAATKEFGEVSVKPHPHPMSQSRQLVTLLKDEADVMWGVTDIEREQRLLAIKFPLLKGYSGYRVLVINPAKQSQFDKRTTDGIKQLTMVQGTDWPDLDVLKSNGYKVNGEDWSLWFQSMYAMVDKGLVDAFPRNIIEVHRGLERHADKAVTLEKNHLLFYPNYEFFFVNPNNFALANRLRIGLIRILESGELEAIFNSFDAHRKAQTIADDHKRQIHILDNPTMSYVLPYARWDKQTDLAINTLKQMLYQ